MARLLYFGRLSDIADRSMENLDLPDHVKDTAALRAWADERFSADGALLEPTVRLAINNAFADEPAAVNNSDEIAFLPPVGGG